MNKKEPSKKTKQEVYNRWRGKCAFCGIDLTVEEHHIIPKNANPSLINNPENLILLCSNHHSLTRKMKPNGNPAISFNDIKDLINSKFAKAEKRDYHLRVPKDFSIILGANFFSRILSIYHRC